MGAFVDDVVDHTAEVVEEDGALAAVNIIERGVQNWGSSTEPKDCSSEVREKGNYCLAAALFPTIEEGSHTERFEWWWV